MNSIIRPWIIEDAPYLARALNNLKIHDNLRDGLPYPYTAADAKEYIHSILNAPKDSLYAWAIIVEGKAAGSIGIFRKDNIHCRTAEMGYYLAEPYWGQGIMTSAVKEACRIVFETSNIVRIFAEPFADNTASCSVLEKAGFALEGTLRKNAIKNGKIIDMKMYSLISDQS